MEPFLIVMTVLLLINLLFLSGALLYTIVSKDDGKIPGEVPRISVSPSTMTWAEMPRRHSSHPQVMLYHNLVRKSIASEQEEPKKSFWQKFSCGNAGDSNKQEQQ